MEFESRIAGFAAGLFLAGSYMMLFGLQEDSGFLMAVSLILLLLVAFRDHRPGRAEAIGLLVAVPLFIIFMREFDNSTLFPLMMLLLCSLIALNARPEAFLPPLAGLLCMQFTGTSALVKGFNLIFSSLSPFFGINDLNYIILYHSQTKLPIVIDDIKLLLPFYLAVSVAQIALLALLKIDRKEAMKRAVLSIAIVILFVIIAFKDLIASPSTAAFFPDNMQALAMPAVCIFLLSAVMPGACIRSLQKKAFTFKKATAPLLIIFFIAALLYYTPITASSDPLIIIDESHSEWEPSWTDYTKTFEKDPISGVNNYYGLLNMLSSIYNVTLIIDRPEKNPAARFVDTALSKEITLGTLENISQGRKTVLVLKCVTRPYSISEAEAVVKFAKEGNGLILISEHTDIYGMCTNLNPVAELIGYRFLPTGVQDIYTDSRGSITEKDELPALISRYMTGDLLWETSNSLEKLDGSSNGLSTLFEVMTRSSFFAHYRNETSAFFLTRDFTDEIKMNSLFARHLVMAGTAVGDGKAVLFTDSTQFNNGIIGIGDHAQLFIGMVEFAASSERVDKKIMAILLIIIALILVVLNRRNPASIVLIIFILLLISLAASYPLAHFTTSFPDLKNEPAIVALKADDGYIADYFSGMMDPEKLMDKYLRQNQTAIIFQEPSTEWFGISSRVESLQDAIAGL